jgi:hypothetical protein
MRGAALAFIAALAFAGQDQTRTLAYTATNLKFDHSTTWQIKKVKDDYKIIIPLGIGKDSATLDLFAISFMAAPEVWEGTQEYFAKDQKLTVLSKSREEILGVPMLLFKLQDGQSAEKKTTLAGIIYAASEYKLLFRLTAQESVFPEAEIEFRKALESLATIDGVMPQPERPGRATEASAGKRKPFRVEERPITALGPNGTEKRPAVIGKNAIAQSVAGLSVELRGPKEWRFEVIEGALKATHPQLAGDIRITLFSIRDSVAMPQALSKATIDALARFDRVSIREETPRTVGLPETKTIRVYREGVSGGKPMSLIQAGGEKGEFYWLLEHSQTAALDAKTRKLIDGLILSLSIEMKA